MAQAIPLPGDVSTGEHYEERQAKKRAEAIDHAVASQIDPRETVVISGFWRSGTTWLQEYLAELLQAKTIFEPFHFLVPASKKLFKHYGIAKKPEAVRELFIPYAADRPFAPESLLYYYYDGALRADLSGRAVRVLRKDVSESYRPRVVVKFTRGQFSLHAAHHTFAMPVIHVYRDPRAVVASAKMTDWYCLFDHLDLPEQLLAMQDGRAEFFGCYADVIREFGHDKVARIAAYWALTEKFIQEAFAKDRARFIAVSYEKLNREKESLMPALLAGLGIRAVQHDKLAGANKDSFSTSSQRQGVSTEERIRGWQKALSRAEIAVIETVAQRLNFGDRLEA